ncbi:MAG: hypothetical protein HY881_04695 [Deltaproteobacteria bacterium]|nr:hypothetical protein [Deltaproteobacteria bacterium]
MPLASIVQIDALPSLPDQRSVNTSVGVDDVSACVIVTSTGLLVALVVKSSNAKHIKIPVNSFLFMSVSSIITQFSVDGYLRAFFDFYVLPSQGFVGAFNSWQANAV